MDENKTQDSSNINAPIFDVNLLGATKALFEHDQINMTSNKKPVNTGVTDDFSEVRLRVAQIDNYLIERNGQNIDPLKVDNVINMNTGKVVIKWIEYNGGVVRPESFGYPSEGYTEDWQYFPDKDSKYPEKRKLDCYNHDKASNRESLDLTHAFIWNNGSNWCGMNYLPPVGSIVVVGFKKGGLPIILGYLQTDYPDCKPHIKPGETIIKGYGNNYIHWRLSDKLDINVKSKKGDKDLDDPYKKDTYPNTIEMWMRFDCYTRNLVIDVNQTDSGNKKRSTIEIKPENIKFTSKNVDNNGSSVFNISPNDIYGTVDGNSKVYVSKGEASLSNSDSKVKVSSGLIDINTGGSVNIKANSITMKASSTDIQSTTTKIGGSSFDVSSSSIGLGGSNLKITSSNVSMSSSVINLTASGGLTVGGSNINLNSGSNIVLNAPGAVNGSSGRYNFN